jgi:glycosyltransferase involved in cell wall biosynthesis
VKAQILLAVHNPRPDLFKRQLESLRLQTVTDWQCLILDDASAEPRLTEAALNDPRFVLTTSASNLGPYRAFETLLAAAQDVPVFFCDQDDYWHPRKLERLLAVPGNAFSAMRVVDDQGTVLRDRFLPAPTSLTACGLLLMNCVSGTSLKITPGVRASALPFPAPTLRGWHDQWLAAVAARTEGLTYVDEALVDYTQHAQQVIGDGLRRLNRRRLRAFVQTPELRSRADWVRTAAYRLLLLPGPPDDDLQALAAGDFAAVLRRYDLPRQRSLLLLLGGRSLG